MCQVVSRGCLLLAGIVAIGAAGDLDHHVDGVIFRIQCRVSRKEALLPDEGPNSLVRSVTPTFRAPRTPYVVSDQGGLPRCTLLNSKSSVSQLSTSSSAVDLPEPSVPITPTIAPPDANR